MGKVYTLRRLTGYKSQVILEYGEIWVRSWCEQHGKQFNESWSAKDVFEMVLPTEDPYLLAKILHGRNEFYFMTTDN
jgi:hypothetical protein